MDQLHTRVFEHAISTASEESEPFGRGHLGRGWIAHEAFTPNESLGTTPRVQGALSELVKQKYLEYDLAMDAYRVYSRMRSKHER